MKITGINLNFVSQIKRDGSGTTTVPDDFIESLNKEIFKILCLSITEKTFVAIGFNSFVVRLKDKEYISKRHELKKKLKKDLQNLNNL